MRKGDIVVNPWVSAYFNGELNPNYATIYLGDNKSLDYNGRVCEWADKIYKDNHQKHTPWKAIGHIDLCGIAELAIRDAVFAEKIADTSLTDAEITELAKEIVHKMIDNANIAEYAYPDLRRRMHEAVERLDEYYPSEDERSE